MFNSLLIKPNSLAERQELRQLNKSFLEINSAYFVATSFTLSPIWRGNIISQLTTEGDIACTSTAFWIHTGITTPDLARQLRINRQDEKYRHPQSRRRFPATHIEKIGGQLVTTRERTAVDGLRENLVTGVERLIPLLKAGSSLTDIYQCSKEIRGTAGIKQARSVLKQLCQLQEQTGFPFLNKSADENNIE